MVSSNAATVSEYLAALPADKRAVVLNVRLAIRDNLPKGYVETMQSGMIAYSILLSHYPKTYNGQPLMYAALAAQKNHMAVYLMGIYADPELRAWFEGAYSAAGKKLDAGKSCVRFKTLDDVPLQVIGEAIARVPAERFIEMYEAARSSARKKTRKAQRVKVGKK